ncbi:MAG: winged helix-turn-helix domain-containing protein [Myxococcales bacterium]|nr:winged helix-turn-helix domain-containing protein [Myxococcales bacterium]
MSTHIRRGAFLLTGFTDSGEISGKGKRAILSGIHYQIVELLFRHGFFSRSDLPQSVQAINTAICRIRSIINSEWPNGDIGIETRRSDGYILNLALDHGKPLYTQHIHGMRDLLRSDAVVEKRNSLKRSVSRLLIKSLNGLNCKVQQSGASIDEVRLEFRNRYADQLHIDAEPTFEQIAGKISSFIRFNIEHDCSIDFVLDRIHKTFDRLISTSTHHSGTCLVVGNPFMTECGRHEDLFVSNISLIMTSSVTEAPLRVIRNSSLSSPEDILLAELGIGSLCEYARTHLSAVSFDSTAPLGFQRRIDRVYFSPLWGEEILHGLREINVRTIEDVHRIVRNGIGHAKRYKNSNGFTTFAQGDVTDWLSKALIFGESEYFGAAYPTLGATDEFRRNIVNGER